MRALVEAGVAITSELSLDALLQRLVEAAAELTAARYAALGVIDQSGSELERFLTTGMDAETHAAIGELPRGRGILGVLISEDAPLRLHNLGEDPRSVGFPPNHPPMNTFLGVPIHLRGVAYGNLYLTEKAGGADFTEEDQELVGLLASQAAVAIENARLYEAATRWSKQLESLNEVGNALATEIDLDRLLDLIARRLRELLDARLVTVLLPGGADEMRFAAVAGDETGQLLGETITRSTSKTGRVLERGQSERVDSVLDDPDIDPHAARLLAARTGLWVPLLVRGRAIGVLAAHDKLGHDVRFTDTDLRLAETFADRAALAVDMSERIASDSLRRAVEAQESERRRIARELHDETGQALTSILLGLKGLEEQLGDADSREAAAELRELVVSTLQDVRRLAVELRPSALDDFGLVAALERLTDLVRRADRDRDRLRDIARRRATPERCRDRPLSHRPGVADERRQARTRASREHPARTPEWRDQGCSRGRRTGIRHVWGGARRLRVGRHARASRAPRGPARGRVWGRERHDGRCRGADRMSIRVLIVDDHAVVRAGLVMLINAEKDLEAVGEAGSARDAIFEARSAKPDVVLMDVMMPQQGGIEVVPQLLKEHPEAKVLVLSMQDDPRYVREAFEAGASGYVLKEAADAELVAAIRDVAGGGQYVNPELGARLVAAETAERRRAEEDPLSDREREVLRLLALGHTNQEIAKELFISVRTAETHRAHIMQKLRLSSRAELVRYALAEGLLESRLRTTDGPPEGGPFAGATEDSVYAWTGRPTAAAPACAGRRARSPDSGGRRRWRGSRSRCR